MDLEVNGGMTEVGAMGIDGVMVAAHELKAPLLTLRQLALGLDGLEGANEEMRSEMVKVSERAIRQVNDLTKIRQIEARGVLMGPVSVGAVCDEVTMELKRLFDEEKRGILVRQTKQARLVTANKEMLKSVVYNFLLNAMHYGDAGTRTEISTRETRGRVRILVRDFGPELPMEVWREMRRGWVDRPTSIAMRPGSSGLGLFIASRFSRAMGGRVGAVRHRDGTSFYVELLKSKQLSFFGEGDL